jgi:hypothetical protein
MGLSLEEDYAYKRVQHAIAQQASSGSIKLLDPSAKRIPPIPEGIEHLSLQMMHITELPPLPESLEVLDLGHLDITTLPVLPASLKHLYLNGNWELTSLPDHFPPTLEVFYCAGSQKLASIPPVPASMTELTLEKSGITELPPLDTTELRKLDLTNSFRLQTLPPLPPTLGYLDISYTNISVLPPLPASLRILRANNAKLKSLPADLPNLELLWVEKNQLLSLPILPTSITSLHLENNPLPNEYRYWIEHEHNTEKLLKLCNEITRRSQLRQRGRNVAAFRQTLASNRGNLFLGPTAPSALRDLPKNISGTIGSFLSGETGNAKTQALKLRETQSRWPEGPGASRRGGTRKNRRASHKRKGYKARTRINKKRIRKQV